MEQNQPLTGRAADYSKELAGDANADIDMGGSAAQDSPTSALTVPLVCQGCMNFKFFNTKCWFFWEGKKECSQFRVDAEGNTRFRSVKDRFDIF